MINKKIKHNLHLANNSFELISCLQEYDIDVESIVKSHLIANTSFSVLAVGSITRPYANSESDVDFLVLIESASDFISNNDDVNLEYGNSLEVLLYVNGVELNFDFMAKDRLRGVVESFISIAPALYNPEEMKSLILIGWEDVQFLDRLRNGWIIYNPKEIELWRDEFMVELLPTYIAVREYFEGIEFLEDAISAKKGINKSATYIGRMVVERGLFALLGSLGYTNQSKKWLFYWIEEVKDDSTRELLNSGVELLFPENPNKDSLTEIEYVDKVAVFYRLVRRELDQNVAIAKAIKFLNSKINYIDLDIENDH